jgi:carbon-monoxide dehydrogenase medium subunit
MQFDSYYEPTTVTECIQMLDDCGPDGRLLAGGTDLVYQLKKRTLKVKAVISLQAVADLGRVDRTGEGIHIGAMARLADLSRSAALVGPWRLVGKGAGHVSSIQIRNTATIGGNSCNASPSADTAPPLIVLDAMVNIANAGGKRVLPLDRFFVGPGQTALQQGEIVTGFTLPNFGPRNGTAYKKYAIRGDTDITIVGVGARLKLAAGGQIEEARLALGSVAPTPLRVPKVESMLVGYKLTEELAAEAGAVAAAACQPITDGRATKAYRREMVRIWTRHALLEAYEQAAKAY